MFERDVVRLDVVADVPRCNSHGLRVVGVDLKVGDVRVTRERLGHGRRVRTEPNCGPNLDKLSS